MLKAEDLWPLVVKLPRQERVRLARMALVKSTLPASACDDERYAVMPVGAEEFGGPDEDLLAWDGEGWEGVK